MSKKRIALLMAVVMVLGVAVGSTMAWLTSGATPVVNTFTVGDINITLLEHDLITKSDVEDTNRNLKEEDIDKLDMTTTVNKNDDYFYVPGDTLPKDPFVTVQKDSEACFLFVKVVESGNIDVTGKDASGQEVTEKALKYAVDAYDAQSNTDGWHYDSTNDMWYREVAKVTADAGVSFDILKDNEVKVSTYITKDSDLETTKPVIKFYAFAHQSDNTDLATATTAADAYFDSQITLQP